VTEIISVLNPIAVLSPNPTAVALTTLAYRIIFTTARTAALNTLVVDQQVSSALGRMPDVFGVPGASGITQDSPKRSAIVQRHGRHLHQTQHETDPHSSCPAAQATFHP